MRKIQTCTFRGCTQDALKDRFCGYHWRSHARWLEAKLVTFQTSLQVAVTGCIGCNTTGEVLIEAGNSIGFVPCPLCTPTKGAGLQRGEAIKG